MQFPQVVGVLRKNPAKMAFCVAIWIWPPPLTVSYVRRARICSISQVKENIFSFLNVFVEKTESSARNNNDLVEGMDFDQIEKESHRWIA